jgi:hypothetical protein
MFPTVAIVNHVEESDDDDRFYAQAELILTQDVSHAQLELEDVHLTATAHQRSRKAFESELNHRSCNTDLLTTM